MSDLYDILGVKKNASKDEIKKAYKKKASKAHPDREGGSDEEMSALNQAYGLLMDDAKRAEYDHSGATFQPSTSQQAVDLFIQMLNVAIDSAQSHGQIIGMMWDGHRGQVGELKQASTENAKHLKGYRKKEKKIKYKGKGINLFHEVLQNKIRTCENNEFRIANALLILEEVKKLLADYEAEPDDFMHEYRRPMYGEDSARRGPTEEDPASLVDKAEKLKRLNKIFGR